MSFISTFNGSINDGTKYLKGLKLIKSTGLKNTQTAGLSEDYRRHFRSSYDELFKAGLENFDYDILLFDDSYFQFSYSKNPNLKVRYAFHQSPFQSLSYEEFLIIKLQLDIDEVGVEYLELFEQFIISSQGHGFPQYLRYDYDIIGYKPNIHSVSHLHINHISEARIPCAKILTPLVFILFVIKNIYFEIWREKFCKFYNYVDIIGKAHNGCFSLDRKTWCDTEKYDLHLYSEVISANPVSSTK